MGTSHTRSTPLADALFPSVQRRLLALLYGDPGRSFQSAELIRLARGGTGGVHRLLARLADAGWVTVTRIGNQKHYRANAACPAFRELHELVMKTLRVPAPREPAAARREPERLPAPPPDEAWKAW